MKHGKMALLILALFLVNMVANLGCATNPHKAVAVDTKVQLAASAGPNQVVGVKGGDMIVQRKVLMSEELRTLQYETYGLEAHVYGGYRYLDNAGMWGVLRECRKNTALQVDGKLPWQEPRDYVIPEDESTQIGIEDGRNIVGVEEEYLKDRIARFVKYRDILRKRAAEYEDKLEACKTNLQYMITQSGK